MGPRRTASLDATESTNPMKVDALLSKLQKVRPRGSGRWFSICPAHEEKTGSLSIREGSHGRILLHDFGGCSVEKVLNALGLRLRDLFADIPLFRVSPPMPKPPRFDRRRIALDFELHAISLQKRAEKTFHAASGLDCTSWSGDDFDRAMDAVGRAFDDLRHAEILLAVADSQREKAYWEGR